MRVQNLVLRVHVFNRILQLIHLALQRLDVLLMSEILCLQLLLVLFLQVFHFHQDISYSLLGLVCDYFVLLQLLLLLERERYVTVCGHCRRVHSCGMELSRIACIIKILKSLILIFKGEGGTEVAQRGGRFSSGRKVLYIVVHVFQGVTPLDVVSDSFLSLTNVDAGNHKNLLVSDFRDCD